MATTDKSSELTEKTKTVSNNVGKAGIVVIVIAGALVVFMAGVAVERHTSGNRPIAGKMGFARGAQLGQRPMGGLRKGLGGGQRMSANENRLSGVVTSVNGTSFTLAGNGATNTVQTTSSTTFTGASKVAVNDSVEAVGTTNNGTFTATQVLVNP